MTTDEEIKLLEAERDKLKAAREADLQKKKVKDDLFRLKHPTFIGVCKSLSTVGRGIKGLFHGGLKKIQQAQRNNAMTQQTKPQPVVKEVSQPKPEKQETVKEPQKSMDFELDEIASMVR